jgi:hypothetical protein
MGELSPGFVLDAWSTPADFPSAGVSGQMVFFFRIPAVMIPFIFLRNR